MVAFVFSDESNSEKYDRFLCPKLDVEELEMLLEAYFEQTNGILQRLTSVSIDLLNSFILSNTNENDYCRFSEKEKHLWKRNTYYVLCCIERKEIIKI